MLVWDLEYLLLFGPPENKLELLDGKMPTSFPFLDRTTAEAHFELWARTLARWHGVVNPPARSIENMRVKEFGAFRLEQHRRPIRLEVPSEIDAYHWAHRSFYDRGLWPMQPAGFEKGIESSQDHWRIKHNLWRLFRDAQERPSLPAAVEFDDSSKSHEAARRDDHPVASPLAFTGEHQHVAGRQIRNGDIAMRHRKNLAHRKR